MPSTPYVFSQSQGAFLDALKDGRYRGIELMSHGGSVVSLRERMPPVYQQAMRGTCVANAATALLEYYEDCKMRLSVQFLHEMMKTVERNWLDANLRALEENREVDAEFAEKFPAQVAQIRLTADANGAGSPAAKAFVSAFARQLKDYFDGDSGSQIKRCFDVIRDHGTCRYALWPYASMPVEGIVSGATFPPGSREDALKHRVQTGLYLLRSPNNVDEIRGILAGANGRRPMPVCVGLPIFEGCDNEQLLFPTTEERDGRLVSRNAFKGVHEMLIVGYEDDRMVAGGGWFVVRNSWGSDWGKDGYGKVPYAYVECFCTEAGTILQDMVDYAGDGYGNGVAAQSKAPDAKLDKRRSGLILLICGIAFAGLLIAILAPSRMQRGDETPPPRDPLKHGGGAVSAAQIENARLVEERRIAEENRQAEEKRLAQERAALEAEKARIAAERRQAEERAAAEAKARREAEEKAAAEAKAKRETEEKRLAEEKRIAEENRIAEEKRLAEKKRLEDERRAAEKKAEEERIAAERKRMEAEKAKPREYLVHIAIVCNTEAERTAVESCLKGMPEEKKDGETYAVGNVSVTEYDAGRNMFGMSQKSYRLKCDMTILNSDGTIQRPTESAKGYLGAILNEKCQIEGEDRIDWSNFTRSTYQQDFRTVSGVRTGF